MKTALKIITVIIIIGVVLGGVGLIVIKSQHDDLSAFFNADEEYTKYEQTLSDIPDEISIEADNKIIKIIEHDEQNLSLTYYQSETDLVNYEEENNNLIIENTQDYKNWWRFFDFRNLSNTVRTITVKVPQSFEGALDIRTNNGFVEIENLGTIEKINCQTSNGRVSVKNLSIEENTLLKSSNGTIAVENVSCYAQLRMETSNGKIIAEDVIASHFEGSSSNGDINLDNIDSSDIEASTSDGAIVINLIGEFEDYEYRVDSDWGNILIDGVGYSNQTINSGADKIVTASTSNGKIKITFN